MELLNHQIVLFCFVFLLPLQGIRMMSAVPATGEEIENNEFVKNYKKTKIENDS